MKKYYASVSLSFLLFSCVEKIGPIETDPDSIVFYPPVACKGNVPTLEVGPHQYCTGARVMNGEPQGVGVSYLNVGTVRELLPKSNANSKDQIRIFIEDQKLRAPEYGSYIYASERLSRAYRCILRSTPINSPGAPTMACQGGNAYDRDGKKVTITEVFSNGYARVFFKENRPSLNGVIENKITETRELNHLRPFDSSQFYNFDCNQAFPKNCSGKF